MRLTIVSVCMMALVAGCTTQSKPNPRARAVNTRRGPKRQMLSPIGGYMVTSVSPNKKSPERDLVITRPNDKHEILRFPFQRQVDVVWAPDETAVAVVDLVLANETRVVIFELPTGRPLFELRRDMVCQLNPNLPCGNMYTHVFFSNVIWLAPDRIQATVDMINPLDRNLPPQIRDIVIAQFPR